MVYLFENRKNPLPSNWRLVGCRSNATLIKGSRLGPTSGPGHCVLEVPCSLRRPEVLLTVRPGPSKLVGAIMSYRRQQCLQLFSFDLKSGKATR